MLNERMIADFIKAFPFANELGEKKVEFLQSLYHRRIAPGSAVLDENGECSGVIFVLKGLIRIYKLSSEGKEITLYSIGRGETCVFSVSCLLGLGDMPFPVAATAEQLTEAVFIPPDIFKRMFYESPALQKYFFSSLSAKFYSVLGLLENVAFKRTSDRLMNYLVTKTSGGVYPLYSTHDKIASELGTAREVVSRLLKEMEGNGCVKLSRGKITLNLENIEKLKSI